MAQRMVKCVKFGRELPGLDEPPWSGELGQRIYDNVSQEAWKMWLEHLKMLIWTASGESWSVCWVCTPGAYHPTSETPC